MEGEKAKTDPWRQLKVITASSVTNLAVYLCMGQKEEPRNDTSEDTSVGKLTEVPKCIVEAIKAERAESSEAGRTPTANGALK